MNVMKERYVPIDVGLCNRQYLQRGRASTYNLRENSYVSVASSFKHTKPENFVVFSRFGGNGECMTNCLTMSLTQQHQ